MRLTNQQAVEIVKLARQIAQGPVAVRVFGSRLNDDTKGGDLDLLVEPDEAVANTSAFPHLIRDRCHRSKWLIQKESVLKDSSWQYWRFRTSAEL